MLAYWLRDVAGMECRKMWTSFLKPNTMHSVKSTQTTASKGLSHEEAEGGQEPKLRSMLPGLGTLKATGTVVFQHFVLGEDP